MRDLSEVSIEELQEAIRSKKIPEPIFERDGKKYYDTVSYNKLLEYFDENNKPQDYTPIEFKPDGSISRSEPKFVVVNFEALTANRLYVEPNGKMHVVFDTRTIRELETGEVSLTSIPEFVVTHDARTTEKIKVTQSVVTREEFLKNYTSHLGMNDALKILLQVDRINTSDDMEVSLDSFISSKTK